MVITYYQSPFLLITYDDQHQLGILEATGFLSSNEFREGISMGLQLIQEHQPLRWLADNRKMKAIRQADQDWFYQNIFPGLKDSSIRRNATVVSEDIFNKMAVEQLLKRGGGLGDMTLKEFESREEAQAWVLQPIEND